MILEVDAGNSRIKWRLISDSGGVFHTVFDGVVLAENEMPVMFAEMNLQFESLPFADISRMRVSSVRGEKFQEVFASVMRDKWDLQPEFAKVEQVCGGLTNSYDDVSVMGIDRWLAMLAAYQNAGGACCVVDCGSAITLDLVSGQGLHLGGYIVPGLNLMQRSLAEKSAALEFSDSQWGLTDLGMDTRSAVNQGILSMVLGLFERVRAQSVCVATTQWFVTGGDAAVLSPLLNWEHRLVPDLVMNGLAIARP